MISVYPQILPYRTPYGLKFQIQLYRTMVGPHYLAVNLRILQILFQGRRGDEIVNVQTLDTRHRNNRRYHFYS